MPFSHHREAAVAAKAIPGHAPGRRARARATYETGLASCHAALGAALRLPIDGAPKLDRIFVTPTGPSIPSR